MENTFAEFLLDAGLYDCKEINEKNIGELIDLIGGRVKINCFCTECKEMRIFSANPILYYRKDDERNIIYERNLSEEIKSLQENVFGSESDFQKEHGNCSDWQWKNWQIDEDARVIVFKFICSLDGNHHLDFAVLADNSTFRKIGQYPSLADLSFPELKQYQKSAPKEDLKELRRAIGLYAQGIGVGAYVYLRRVLERLIEHAKDIAMKEGTITQEEYEGKRVVERIKLLNDYLPELLVSNSTIYGIVSKGIHELSEEECIAYFPVLQECIFMILERWEQQRKKIESEKKITAALGQITSKVSK